MTSTMRASRVPIPGTGRGLMTWESMAPVPQSQRNSTDPRTLEEERERSLRCFGGAARNLPHGRAEIGGRPHLVGRRDGSTVNQAIKSVALPRVKARLGDESLQLVPCGAVGVSGGADHVFLDHDRAH